MKAPWLILAIPLVVGGCGDSRFLNLPIDGGGRAINSPATEQEPAIAGPYLIFLSDRNGSQDIYLFDQGKRRFLDLPGLNALTEITDSPSVSADGRYIVFAMSQQGRTEIYLYDRELQQKRPLNIEEGGEVRRPMISADGNTITFETARNGQWDVVVYSRNGQKIAG